LKTGSSAGADMTCCSNQQLLACLLQTTV